MARVYWEASRNSRYLGTRRGIGHQAALGTPRGCRSHLGGARGNQWV